LPLQTVHALTVRHDTVWVGAESGLYRVVGEVPQLVAPTSRPVLDLAWAADRLVMITSAGVLTFEHERISTPVRHTALQQIGRPVSVSALGDRVYIGGEQGVAEWQPAQNAWRYLTVPNDLPEGPVFDVIEENGRLWLATPAGAMRLQWR
jgi:ligand-binding sensor domain-containing protein